MVTLNQAVAVAMVRGPEAGLELLATLDADDRMAGHHRLAAVRAHLQEMAGDHGAARERVPDGRPPDHEPARAALPRVTRLPAARRPIDSRAGPAALPTAPAKPELATATGEIVEWRLELVQVPVSDVDRAKAFYTDKAGFNADHDHQVSDEMRFVQLTPPGSPTSIAIGTGITDMAPGSLQGLQMVVADIDAARAELVARDVDVSDVQHFPWGSFVFFSDPDGNGWAVQAIPHG